LRFFRRTPRIAEPDTGTPEAPVAVEEPEAPSQELQQQTEQVLERTRRGFFGQIAGLFDRGGGIDESLWEELEELLIGADVGVATTQTILERTRERVSSERIKDAEGARGALKETLVELLRQPEGRGRLWGAAASEPLPKPAVILVLGVNGTGKTTTIAKLGRAYQVEAPAR
jgi:fused signal recognition particle receptor